MFIGGAFTSDTVQRPSYRRNRQRELDKFDFEARKRNKEAVLEKHKQQREEINKTLEEKTAKRRLRRLAKQNKRQKSKDSPSKAQGSSK